MKIYIFVTLLFTSFLCGGQVTPYLDSLLNSLKTQDPDAVDLNLLNKISMVYAEVDPTEGMKYARQARDLAIKRNALDELGRAYNCIATNWLMLLEMDSSMHYYNIALDIYKKEENKKGIADIYGNMGHNAYYRGKYDEALRYYFESLTYFEDLDNKEGIATQHLSIGSTYMVQEKFQDAIYHDSIALRAFGELKDSMTYAMVLGNLGNVYSETKVFDMANQYYHEAADIYSRTNQPMGVGRTLVNLAGNYIDQGLYQDALDAAQKAYKICNENNIRMCVQYSLSNIGTAFLESYRLKDDPKKGVVPVQGDQKELLRNAIYYLEQAVQITDKLEAPEDFENTHKLLSTAYKLNGQYEKALQHFEFSAVIKDSLESVERAGRIEQLITEREIAVRDKQIELDKLRLKVKRNERIYFIIGLVLLGGWLSLVYRNALNQRRSNQQLSILNNQISDTNFQLEDKNTKLTDTLEQLKSTQAQLIEAERQKENEILRRRISRDIHDDISSGLSKISWMTELLRNTPESKEPVDQDVLNRIASYSRETVSKLGEIIWSTKPESDNFNALLSYCREFLNRYLEGIPIRAHIDFPENTNSNSINPELRRNLYLVLKESVHNAVKYSRATDLNISLHTREGIYKLVVEDNGIGINLQNGATNGNGLRNMQARMKEVGGEMKVKSESGKGTRLEFTGPVY